MGALIWLFSMAIIVYIMRVEDSTNQLRDELDDVKERLDELESRIFDISN